MKSRKLVASYKEVKNKIKGQKARLETDLKFRQKNRPQ